MDPILVWLNQQENEKRWKENVGKPANSGTFGGPASGTSVAPVVPNSPQFNPAPTVPIGQTFTPDYGALIQADPGYQAYLSNSAKDVEQGAAQRRTALQQLAVQYGGLPTGFKDPYGDIDAGTLQLAGQNQFSDTAMLQKNYADSIEAFKRALAARGALQSGDLGYGLSEAELAHGQNEYQMGLNFTNAAQGAVNSYLGVESRAREGQAGALSQAQANVYANPANRPIEPYDAPYEMGSMESFGQPLYRGRDGQLYTSSGQIWGGGAGAAPQAATAPPPSGDYGAGAPVYRIDPSGQIVEVPQGWIFPPGEFGLT